MKFFKIKSIFAKHVSQIIYLPFQIFFRKNRGCPCRKRFEYTNDCTWVYTIYLLYVRYICIVGPPPLFSKGRGSLRFSKKFQKGAGIQIILKERGGLGLNWGWNFSGGGDCWTLKISQLVFKMVFRNKAYCIMYNKYRLLYFIQTGHC